MNNLILSITRNTIPYVKELRPIAGSVTACILMQQLDYWFSKKPDGYYKFISPCDHTHYVPGDSWCEELDFSVEEYRSAFEKIGIRYKSKSLFMKAKDKFCNKYYASYHDRQNNQTFYVRNHQLLDDALYNLIVSHKDPKGGGGSHKNASKGTKNISSSVTRESLVTGNSISPVTVTRESLVLERGNPDFPNEGKPHSLYRTDTTTDITTDISPLSLSSSKGYSNLEREMISIWNKVVGEGTNPISLTRERTKLLMKSLQAHFNQDMEAWRQFCEKIASSKFLMGEITSFKASIDWATKPQNITKILEHTYKLGDRKPLPVESNELTPEQKNVMAQTDYQKALKKTLQEIQWHAQSQRNKDMVALEETFTPEDLSTLKQEFRDKAIHGEIPAMAGLKDYFKDLGWGMPGVDILFMDYKQSKLLPDLEHYLMKANETLGHNIPDLDVKMGELLG